MLFSIFKQSSLEARLEAASEGPLQFLFSNRARMENACGFATVFEEQIGASQDCAATLCDVGILDRRLENV